MLRNKFFFALGCGVAAKSIDFLLNLSVQVIEDSSSHISLSQAILQPKSLNDSIEIALKDYRNLCMGDSQLNKKFGYFTIPFNRKIKYIYNIDSVDYPEYENYDFNKLSDFFLNIHIFVN